MKYIYLLLPILAAGATSCLGDGNETLVFTDETPQTQPEPTEADNLKIPDDASASEAPEIKDDEINTEIPNSTAIVVTKGAYGYIPMSGLKSKDGNWLLLKGTGEDGQNTWLTIDGDPKGVDLIETKSAWTQNAFLTPTDLVFLINNSSSMAEEVNVLVDGISEWVDRVTNQGIDLRTGFVSYDEGQFSINGASDLTEPADIINYLHRDGSTGTARTSGFTGSAAQKLEEVSHMDDYINDYSNECEVLALRFAHDRFDFRPISNRIYINLTDEPNQPGGRAKWSVDVLRPQNGFWMPSYGTVYCVYSGNTDFTVVPQITEQPWLMAEYTGGIAQFCPPDFAGVSLLTLEATQAITHSHLIRFRTTDAYNDDKTHTVKITVATPDGTFAEKTMQMTFVKE